MILLLHTLIEATVGLIFLFYPNAGDFVPGFGTSEGPSFDLLMKMYGLAALFLASLTLITYFSRANRVLVLTVTGSLCVFHLAMTIIQSYYNPDPRAMLLHFLLAIFLSGRYIQTRRTEWLEQS
jgi:hypothetical protein